MSRSLSSEKPILAVWATVDTHMPFYGMDDPERYEPFAFGRGVRSNYQPGQIADRYETVLKYTDSYVGKVAQFLKQNMNNTILVVVGDHGAREAPLLENDNIIDSKDNESLLFDNRCNNKPFVNDLAFDTTGLITYFGDN